MSGLTRIAMGIAGGFAASTSKILATDVGQLATLLDHADMSGIAELRVTIFIFTPILMFLGGLVAWATEETNRMKLLAIGCAAPALVAPWTTGAVNLPNQDALRDIVVTTAYAQTGQTGNAPNTFLKGVGVLFGFQSVEAQRYWVVVGSYKDEAGAMAFAAAINRLDPTLQAFVGQKQPGNEFFPVIVGGTSGYLPFEEAERLRMQAETLAIVTDGGAYLSAFADRLPPVGG